MNRDAARNFTLAFIRAMESRGLTHTQLATAIGCSRPNIAEFAKGRIPGPDLAAKLAEAIGEPRLLEYAVKARTINCASCGRAAVARTHRRAYCSDGCQRIGYTLGRRAMSEPELAIMSELTILRGAVDAFCRSCEPEGVCRQAECALRLASPLPLATGRPGPIPARTHGWTPDRRATSAAWMRAEWKENGQHRRAAIARGVKTKREVAA